MPHTRTGRVQFSTEHSVYPPQKPPAQFLLSDRGIVPNERANYLVNAYDHRRPSALVLKLVCTFSESQKTPGSDPFPIEPNEVSHRPPHRPTRSLAPQLSLCGGKASEAFRSGQLPPARSIGSFSKVPPISVLSPPSSSPPSPVDSYAVYTGVDRYHPELGLRREKGLGAHPARDLSTIPVLGPASDLALIYLFWKSFHSHSLSCLEDDLSVDQCAYVRSHHAITRLPQW